MNSVYHQQLKSKATPMNEVFSSIGFRVFLTLLVVVLLVLYVVRLATVSVKGYDISSLQTQVNTLQEENQRLEFEIAKNASMQSIQTRLKRIQFVPAQNPEFATIKPPVIAQR